MKMNMMRNYNQLVLNHNKYHINKIIKENATLLLGSDHILLMFILYYGKINKFIKLN